ncbi:MAG: hypothetical protein NZ896_06740, partial [Nitrososphaerales archaeon]|nr:hypothetical protein [Nitrososphaerales archaeon]
IGYLVNDAIPLLQDREPLELPDDLITQLGRFKFVNKSTNMTLKDPRVVGKVIGSYVEGGIVYETYVIGFEDRPGGAEADLDFLDLMVEFKRGRGDRYIMVRIAQLGHDSIDVFLDDKFIGSVRPSIEILLEKS